MPAFAELAAFGAGQPTLETTIDGEPFRQEPQRYHVKSLGALRARYAAISDRAALDPLLDALGCRAFLTAS